MHKIKGSAMVITTGLFLIFTLFGLSSIYLAGLQNQSIEKQIASTQAFWLAEAGIQRGLWKLCNNIDDWDSSEWSVISSGYESIPWTIGADTNYYVIAILSPESSAPIIESYGFIDLNLTTHTPDKDFAQNYAKRKIQVVFSQNAFVNGVMGKEYVSVKGVSQTDSYSSTNEDGEPTPYGGANVGDNGDVSTNGDMTLNGTIAINGDTTVGIGGEYTTGGTGWTVKGVMEDDFYKEFPPVEIVPDSLLALTPANFTLPAGPIEGDFSYKSIKLTGSDTLIISGETHIYLTDLSTSLSIMGTTAKIEILKGASLEIYANGNVTVAGQGIANDSAIPSNFILYGSGPAMDPAPVIKFSGSNTFYGAVYAPEAGITVAGKGTTTTEEYGVYGSLVGRYVELLGNADVHYDEVLSKTFFPGVPHYSPSKWQDLFEGI